MKKQNAINSALSLVCVLFIGLSCASFGKLSDAQAAVDLFHQRFNNQRFQEIYEDSFEKFKETTSRETATESFRQIRAKYGNYQNSVSTNQISKTANGFTIIKMTFESEFTNGNVTEYFEFVVEDGDPKLTLYNIKTK